MTFTASAGSMPAAEHIYRDAEKRSGSDRIASACRPLVKKARPRRLSHCALLVYLVSSLLTGGAAEAQTLPSSAPEIFKQYSEQVVKIEVVEAGSAAKAAIGTGFFATAAGHIVTNYHVISKLIHSPERYRIDVTDAAGRTGEATVLAVDVIYDLAVLRSTAQPKGFLKFESAPIQQGARLYSLGHPKDLGLTIVEGTYNGLLQHTLYPKIHFTGSLNPGMSGGPTLTQAGRVAGINVATEGEQISYLVPAARGKTSGERHSAAHKFSC
jgi:serine protease Do